MGKAHFTSYMSTSSNLTGTLRRSLLIKVISKPAPSREDVSTVIELTASKVVESLQAQSMTLYLVEGGEIVFRQVYYSPSLWGTDKSKQIQFKEAQRKLLALRLPAGTGNVGKVIQTGRPEEVVGAPADDYVADFVSDVPKSHVLTLRWIMRAQTPDDPTDGPEFPSTAIIRDCLHAATATDKPIRVTSDGQLVGVVDRADIMGAIAGGPAAG